jgi:MoxR-like ATPase
MGLIEEGELVGRAEELERVGCELEAGGVVVEGEAGIGKTTLWRAVERARSDGGAHRRDRETKHWNAGLAMKELG